MNRESGTVPFRNEPPAGFESRVTVGTGDYRTDAIVRTSEELLKTITKRNKRGKAEGGVLAVRTMVSWRRRHSSFSLGVGHQPKALHGALRIRVDCPGSINWTL